MTATYTDNIRAIFEQSTPDDRASGADWYPAARRIVDTIADRSGIAPDRVAAAMAALSPRNPWAWNVQDAAAYSQAASDGADMPSATTFGANRARAWAILRDGADWSTSALKVRSFVANIMGDTDSVTVDVWAIRVATMGEVSTAPNDRTYREVADAYRTVAAEVGLTPRDLQAITWTTAERIGLGSQRRGRHGQTFKRGTFDYVRDMLAA